MKTGDLVSSRGSDVYVIHVADPRRAFYVDRGDGPFVYVGISGRGNGSLVLILLPSGTLVEVHQSRLRLL